MDEGSTQAPTQHRVATELLIALALSAFGLLTYSGTVLHLNGAIFFSLAGPLLGLGLLGLATSLWVARITIEGVQVAHSLLPAGRIFRTLRLRLLISLLTIPILAKFLNMGSGDVALGVLFANMLLIEALPIAVLIAKRRVQVVFVSLSVQWLGAICALELLPTNDGLATTISVAMVAVVSGAMVLFLFAIWLSSLRPTPSPTADLWEPLPLHRRPPGASMCAPVIVSMLQFHHLLTTSESGIASWNALLAGLIIFIAGLLIAANSLPPAVILRNSAIVQGVRTSLTVAAVLTAAMVGLGSFTVSRFADVNTAQGIQILITFGIASIGWTAATFASWVRVARGGSGYPFVVGSALAIGVELFCGLFFHSLPSLAVLPLGGLATYLLAFSVKSGHLQSIEQTKALPREHRAPVSIGVMAYNEERVIESSLTAFLEQESRRVHIAEIIVISSGSTDGTTDVVRRIAAKDERIRLIIEEEKLGKVFSVKHFFTEAAHSICVVASADVTPAPDCVEQLARPLLDDDRVGMTGPRVEPRYRKGFVPMMHRFLWTMHNQANAFDERAKLGEIVAVRREVAMFEPIAGCDEVLIEAEVISSGKQTKYAADAVVYNLSPTSLAEYVQHRRRIHAQHLVTEKQLGYRAATVSSQNGIKLLIGEVLRQPYLLVPAVGCALAEVWGRALGRRDVERSEVHLTWHPTKSARSGNSHGVDLD